MARGMTAVQSRTKPKETISFPVLTYTDALPRNDLRSLDEASQRPAEPAMIGQWDFSQQPAGDGWFRKPSTAQAPLAQAPLAQGTTFDFCLTAPPDEAISSSARAGRAPTGQHMIGIALGSPRMVDKDEPLPPPRFDTSAFDSEKDLPQKPSKWKKIGGFFKAKNAFTSPLDDAQESELKSQTINDTQGHNPRKTKKRSNSTEEWPNLELDHPKMPVQRSQNVPRSDNHTSKDQSNNQSLLLSVDIPNVEMERYSVMFGNVVNTNERPPLLARRAKTLDKLSVPDANGFLKSPAPPPMPQRRATSPARSSFTVFPTSHSSKAAQILGTQNFSRGPSPLVRANTLPIESPSKVLPQPPHHASNANSISSFESPVIPKLFAERSGTPNSLSSYDKPLPAIKPESQPSRLQQSAKPEENTTSPQKIRSQQSVQAYDIAATKPEPRSTRLEQSVPQKNNSPPQKPRPQEGVRPHNLAATKPETGPAPVQQSAQPQINTPSPQKIRPQQSSQPHQGVSTKPVIQQRKPAFLPRKDSLPQTTERPLLPRKDSLRHVSERQLQPRKDSLPQVTERQLHGDLPQTKTSQHQHNQRIDHHKPDHPIRPRLRVQTQGPPQLPPKNPARNTPQSAPASLNPTLDKIDRIMSPLSASTGSKSGISPSGSTRMPFVDADETVDTAEQDPEPAPAPKISIPKIEVSVARSVSVSRAKRQVIVPIGARIDQLDTDERFVQRRPMTPQITGVHLGHRPGISQELHIECL